MNFTANGRDYHLAYYLTDGIYPKWTTFIQSIPIPQGPKAVLFSQRQEAARKAVDTTRKHNLNEGGFPRYFVVKEALRRISEETRLLVTRLS